MFFLKAGSVLGYVIILGAFALGGIMLGLGLK